MNRPRLLLLLPDKTYIYCSCGIFLSLVTLLFEFTVFADKEIEVDKRSNGTTVQESQSQVKGFSDKVVIYQKETSISHYQTTNTDTLPFPL